MNTFFEAYLKEMKMILHDGGLIIFLGLLPFAYPVIYSLIYNPELVRDVDMVVVDHDRTALSRELVRSLDATQEINIIGYASDLAEARTAMDSHECYGILEVPQGFGRNAGRGETAQAVLYSDMSLLLRFRGFMVAATNVAQAMGGELQAEDIDRIAPLVGTLVAGDPMGVENVAMGNMESGFDSYIMPGVLVLILQQCLVLAIGMSGGTKREKGLLAGGPRARSVFVSMMGEGAAYLSLIVVPAIFVLHYVPLIFRFPMAGDALEIFVFILPMVLASIALGFMFQGVCRERETVFVLWVVTSVMFLFLSGLTWPRFSMSPFWKTLSDLVPATFGVEGFIRMNTNGASLSQVAPDYIALWIQAAAYTVIAFFVQSYISLRRRAGGI